MCFYWYLLFSRADELLSKCNFQLLKPLKRHFWSLLWLTITSLQAFITPFLLIQQGPITHIKKNVCILQEGQSIEVYDIYLNVLESFCFCNENIFLHIYKWLYSSINKMYALLEISCFILIIFQTLSHFLRLVFHC